MALRLTVITPDGTEYVRSTSIGADLLTMLPNVTESATHVTPVEWHERRMRGLAYAWNKRPSHAQRKRAQDMRDDIGTVIMRQMDDYASDRDALPTQLQCRERDLMRLAKHWGTTLDDLCALYNHLRACVKFWQAAGQRDLRPAVVLQCEYWALTYQDAMHVAGVRMLRARQAQ